jgi:DNA-binding transcriptional regulator YhcF (GntR family)
MVYRPLTTIIKQIKNTLEKDGELSIRQISIKVKSQWSTTEKALECMKSLDIVKERKGTDSKRDERLFSLK